jgi:glyoxylase-like metal-dependent hydrolase (beta-lactamase superfamily II)
MTLTGTNTYLLEHASGELAVIDPGPEDASPHLETVLARAQSRGNLTTVIVTHRHLDHLPGAVPLCQKTGAILVGHPDLPGVQRPVRDGEAAFGGLIALETPGHTRDSICLWNAATSELFTGDLVLGTGTAVLDDAPDALTHYLASLQRLVQLAPRTIYPGHDPIVDSGVARLREYIDHRQRRVQQVVDVLAAQGPSTPAELTQAIYTETPAQLLPMAARNVRANLDMLLSQERVEHLEDGRWSLRG